VVTGLRRADFRKKLQDDELSGKTAGNILGILHKAMADAVEDGLIDTNPVPKLTRRRRKALMVGSSTNSAASAVRPMTSSTAAGACPP